MSPNVLPLEQEICSYLNLVIYLIGKRNLDDLDDRERIDIKVRDLLCKSSLGAISGISEPNNFFCVGPRSFAPSDSVHEDINCYIKPKEAVERLGNFFYEGKFCLLYGHRQSGKTTTAYAIAEWLLTNHDKDVYTLHHEL